MINRGIVLLQLKYTYEGYNSKIDTKIKVRMDAVKKRKNIKQKLLENDMRGKVRRGEER